MKKFICMSLLMHSCLMASAAQMEINIPPEQDVGYAQKDIVTLSQDCTAIVSNYQCGTIMVWQAPVTLNVEVSTTSAQVYDIRPVALCAEDGMTLVTFIWPTTEYGILNYSPVNCYVQAANYYISFMAARTESI